MDDDDDDVMTFFPLICVCESFDCRVYIIIRNVYFIKDTEDTDT